MRKPKKGYNDGEQSEQPTSEHQSLYNNEDEMGYKLCLKFDSIISQIPQMNVPFSECERKELREQLGIIW